MKLSTVLIAPCATLALVASSATAASAKALPHNAVNKHIVSVTHVTTGKHVTPTKVLTTTRTTHVVYTAPFGPNPITTPIYIYIPAGTPDPNGVMAPVDCSQSPDACTPADLCNIWGEC